MKGTTSLQTTKLRVGCYCKGKTKEHCRIIQRTISTSLWLQQEKEKIPDWSKNWRMTSSCWRHHNQNRLQQTTGKRERKNMLKQPSSNTSLIFIRTCFHADTEPLNGTKISKSDTWRKKTSSVLKIFMTYFKHYIPSLPTNHFVTNTQHFGFSINWM